MDHFDFIIENLYVVGFHCLLFRYASLYFIACIDSEDNELLTLEVIHHFVEVLDRYFENVSPQQPLF